MRFRLCAAALGLVVIGGGLAGCGSSSDTITATTQDFAGDYVGTFGGTLGGAAETGTLKGTIAADGTLTGVSHSNTADADATVTGAITSAGLLNSAFVYPSGTYTATGTLHKNSLRHLVGTLTEFSGTTAIGTIAVDLTRQ